MTRGKTRLCQVIPLGEQKLKRHDNGTIDGEISKVLTCGSIFQTPSVDEILNELLLAAYKLERCVLDALNLNEMKVPVH